MSDYICRIPVPALVDSGMTFPFKPDFGYGYTQDRPIVVHRFGELDAKAEQRFATGIGPRKHAFRRQHLSKTDRNTLAAFWESLKGPWRSFTYNVPSPSQAFTATKVTWEYAPLTIQYLVNACQVGFNFLEVPDPAAAPSYSVNDTCLRYPSSALKTALLSQVQQIIPLVHIRVREGATAPAWDSGTAYTAGQVVNYSSTPYVAIDGSTGARPDLSPTHWRPFDIYLSDRRCTVGGQLYLPRVLGLGESGSDVIITQDIRGTADSVQFTFGNADRVMTALANDTDLKYAQIDLSLYHVNSGILLQLWKGFLISFTTDGTPQFTARASDGLYQITQQYPARVVSRTCWKMFDDGLHCPYSAHGSGGDPTSCDYYFDSANGCQAHGMNQYFGGHPAAPQGVNILDNSTGLWGIGRNAVTATSIISDSVWGQALPEIWCNDDGDPHFAFIHQCLMVDYRDESDFSDSIAIVGAGPIGKYSIDDPPPRPQTMHNGVPNPPGEGEIVLKNADGYIYALGPQLDGFLPQGAKVDIAHLGQLGDASKNNDLGLRQVHGFDPAHSGDTAISVSFSLGQGSPQVWDETRFAAGTAFVEMRVVKSSKLQPSTPDQHQMTVPISQGLTGWAWDAGGTRSAMAGLTNPFWIAVNSFLRALGLAGADSATQKAQFVPPSLIVGDGTGTAEIADDLVDKIVGAGTEKQFRFQGVLAQQKPFRDWLTEILACGLGYYTWQFGKLKLGARINASAVEAFTIGNILFQSLRLEPIEASFEHLVIDFADQNYQYQANTADYQDKSHAAYYGRAGSPLTARQHLVGCATLSQALRLAAVRTREEIGGVTPEEWRKARNAYWQTTILALNTEIGQVVSMTHPDVPGGVGNFRIMSWRLKKDWSIEIAAKTATASMYDLTVGPKPVDVTPDPLPGMFYAIPFGPAWAPYQIQAPANDALFPGEWTFDSNQTYTTMADGSSLATLTVVGKIPVNRFIPGCGAPVVGTIAQATTGGSIPGGQTLRISLCALDANGLPSTPAAIALVQIPTGTNTNQVTLSDIVWPAIAGLATYTVFISGQDDLICAQQIGSLTAGGGGTTYTPTSIAINGPFKRSTWALPSPYVSKLRVKAKRILHSGVIGTQVASVSGSDVVCPGLIDSHSTPFDPTGRVLSVIGRAESSTPCISFLITHFDHTTGTLTVSPAPYTSGHPELSIQALDVVVIRNLADAENSSTPTTVTDSGYCNVANGYGGMTPGVEVGNILRVIAGTGRGQLRKITANTETQLTWDLALTLDLTSVWIVEAPAWDYSADSTTISNADSLRAVTMNVPTDNFINEPLLIGGFTVDVNGTESPDGDVPIREDWIYGAEGQRSAGFALPVVGTLGIQADAAPAFYLNAEFTAGSVKAYVKSAPTGADLTLTIYAGSTAWLSLTIAAGTASVVAAPLDVDAAGPLPANTNIRLAITGVGTTFPGADLSVFVYS